MRLIFNIFISLLLLNSALAEYVITPDHQGGDCLQIGVWDRVSGMCMLNDDITDPILMLGNNLILEGMGFRIDALGAIAGVRVIDGNNIIIRHLYIQHAPTGILVEHSSYVEIRDNTIYSGEFPDASPQDTDSGIRISGKSIKVIDNRIRGFRRGIQIRGSAIELIDNDVAGNAVGVALP